MPSTSKPFNLTTLINRPSNSRSRRAPLRRVVSARRVNIRRLISNNSTYSTTFRTLISPISRPDRCSGRGVTLLRSRIGRYSRRLISSDRAAKEWLASKSRSEWTFSSRAAPKGYLRIATNPSANLHKTLQRTSQTLKSTNFLWLRLQ